MQSTSFTLPLFPLPVFLLPEGMTRLRIFEPRYLNMIKIATKNDGFGILFHCASDDSAFEDWASWVDIVNFDQGSDGVLIIDVKCKHLVSIKEIKADEQGLYFGQAQQQAHWAPQASDALTEQLTQSLRHVFDTHEALKNVYQQVFNDQPVWVVSRWLELMPIEQQMKNVFIESTSFDSAKQFLSSIIIKK